MWKQNLNTAVIRVIKRDKQNETFIMKQQIGLVKVKRDNVIRNYGETN